VHCPAGTGTGHRHTQFSLRQRFWTKGNLIDMGKRMAAIDSGESNDDEASDGGLLPDGLVVGVHGE
jgi:hypothetical protein